MGAGAEAVVQARRLGVGADPHRDVHLLRVGHVDVLALVVVVVLLVLVLGLDPLGGHDDGGTGDARPLLLGDRLTALGAQVRQTVPVQVCRHLLRGEHPQALRAQPLGLGGQSLALGPLVAQPLRVVADLVTPPRVLPRNGQGGDRVGVVLELGEDRGLLQRHALGVHPDLGRLVDHDGQGVVDVRAGQRGAPGDLRGGDPEHGQLLDGVAGLGLAHVLAVDVLADLVDDPVRLLGRGDDPDGHGSGRGADLGRHQGAALAPDDDQCAVAVDVRSDDLQHSARLDRRGERLGVGSGVGADVRADLQLPRVDLVQAADLVSGSGLGHGSGSFVVLDEGDNHQPRRVGAAVLGRSALCGHRGSESCPVDSGARIPLSRSGFRATDCRGCTPVGVRGAWAGATSRGRRSAWSRRTPRHQVGGSAWPHQAVDVAVRGRGTCCRRSAASGRRGG